STPSGGNSGSDSAGGGHAHCGVMCYLGGSWPKEYRGQLFMGNIHGRRLNMDILKPNGSGYVASHGPDFLLANDEWARFINMRYGPDGNVYLIDWYDKQACHNNTPEIWDRTNGRVYKISYRGTKPVQVDLQKCTDEELVKYQLHENQWYVRHARKVLQERAMSRDPKATAAVQQALIKILFEDQDEKHRLHALWAGFFHGEFGELQLSKAMKDSSPFVRAWAYRLYFEEHPKFRSTETLRERAVEEPSPVVRRVLASAAQKIPPNIRWELITGLVSPPEDADDPNLPYLYWYAMEPLAEVDATKALSLAADAKIPQLLPFMARRVGAIGT